MNFLDSVILDFKNRIKVSNDRIDTITDEAERLREKSKNRDLYGELRKYTEMANNRHNIFYCSRCGDKFKKSADRTQHTRDAHEGL